MELRFPRAPEIDVVVQVVEVTCQSKRGATQTTLVRSVLGSSTVSSYYKGQIAFVCCFANTWPAVYWTGSQVSKLGAHVATAFESGRNGSEEIGSIRVRPRLIWLFSGRNVSQESIRGETQSTLVASEPESGSGCALTLVTMQSARIVRDKLWSRSARVKGSVVGWRVQHRRHLTYSIFLDWGWKFNANVWMDVRASVAHWKSTRAWKREAQRRCVFKKGKISLRRTLQRRCATTLRNKRLKASWHWQLELGTRNTMKNLNVMCFPFVRNMSLKLTHPIRDKYGSRPFVVQVRNLSRFVSDVRFESLWSLSSKCFQQVWLVWARLE